MLVKLTPETLTALKLVLLLAGQHPSVNRFPSEEDQASFKLVEDFVEVEIQPEQEKHLDGGGISCPRCDSKDITATNQQFYSDCATAAVECYNCEHLWTDYYRLTGYDDEI